ncbi:hypothetical protein H0H81_008373 [Sphagnurus paluster]|uniref:Uncharacterized protein n=1 Tax=Sphagnurus paluster TaxID=117069 RepID=A0A9P7KIC5_9AGAR|nr:hypothetical protein H0H81_008373 [Sphagnurus paluster]
MARHFVFTFGNIVNILLKQTRRSSSSPSPTEAIFKSKLMILSRVEPIGISVGVSSGQVSSFQPFPFSPGFDIQKVASLAESRPSHSWEYGTTAQALLELYNPSLSVFGETPFPVLKGNRGIRALDYAKAKITLGHGANSLSSSDGSTSDPASLGVSAVMIGKGDTRYAQAAQETVDFLMNSAPRYYNGAISHRVSTPELWADFMYMVPPFLAYYAVDTWNETLLIESVKQCELYRQVLQINTSGPYEGIWQHIIGPESQDAGLWSSGNGWAAAGMTRVLATVLKAPIQAEGTPWRKHAIQNLTLWITEILDGAIASSPDDGLMRNYIDDSDPDARGFGEISGSSLLAAVAYRLAVLQPQIGGGKYLQWADWMRGVLGGKDAGGLPHISQEGIAMPAVNPLTWQDVKPFTQGSPEGQAFVVLMYSAWRDCVLCGRCARNQEKNVQDKVQTS